MIRHAKSSWADSAMTDFERPLNDRGLRDAPLMSERILSFKPQIVVSSPANRAISTARIFCSKWNINTLHIVEAPQIYEAPVQNIINSIHNLPEDKDFAALFGHNPGFTMTVNMLTGFNIDEIPTCGIALLSVKSDKWSDFYTENAILEMFDYPKNLSGKPIRFING